MLNIILIMLLVPFAIVANVFSILFVYYTIKETIKRIFAIKTVKYKVIGGTKILDKEKY
jgi:hypothetical protein